MSKANDIISQAQKIVEAASREVLDVIIGGFPSWENHLEIMADLSIDFAFMFPPGEPVLLANWSKPTGMIILVLDGQKIESPQGKDDFKPGPEGFDDDGQVNLRAAVESSGHLFLTEDCPATNGCFSHAIEIARQGQCVMIVQAPAKEQHLWRDLCSAKTTH
jgi:hypothetical protein